MEIANSQEVEVCLQTREFPPKSGPSQTESCRIQRDDPLRRVLTVAAEDASVGQVGRGLPPHRGVPFDGDQLRRGFPHKGVR